jgi:hypothetical protein
MSQWNALLKVSRSYNGIEYVNTQLECLLAQGIISNLHTHQNKTG